MIKSLGDGEVNQDCHSAINGRLNIFVITTKKGKCAKLFFDKVRCLSFFPQRKERERDDHIHPPVLPKKSIILRGLDFQASKMSNLSAAWYQSAGAHYELFPCY